MDLGDPQDGDGFDLGERHPRILPADLPRSLDDRRRTPPLTTETEVYDAWQGGIVLMPPSPYWHAYCDAPRISSFFVAAPALPSPPSPNAEGAALGRRPRSLSSDAVRMLMGPPNYAGEAQYITAPVPARLNFTIDPDADDDVRGIADSDSRLESMLAAQAALNADESGLGDDDATVDNPKLSDEEKKDLLQKALNMAASNGDVQRIKKLLEGKAKNYLDINAPDEEGSSSLIYASCFVGCLHAWKLAGRIAKF